MMFEPEKWKVFIEKTPWNDSIKVWAGYRLPDGTFHNATMENGSMRFTGVKGGEMPADPLLVLPMDVWQMLVDATTETTPPTKREVIDSELKATKYHLEDMRRLIFDKKE